jgi:hypothetical protein
MSFQANVGGILCFMQFGWKLVCRRESEERTFCVGDVIVWKGDDGDVWYYEVMGFVCGPVVEGNRDADVSVA